MSQSPDIRGSIPDGVVVTRDQIGVVVGPAQVAAAGQPRLDLLGGQLLVDPMVPAHPPMWLVHDANGNDTTSALWGDAVALAVTRLLDAEPGARESHRLVASPERDTAVALAIAIWLRETSIVSWDLPLLALEVDLLRVALQGLLPDDDDGDATPRMLSWAPAVLRWVWLAQDPASGWNSTPAVAALLRSAADSVLVELAPDDERRETLLEVSAGAAGGAVEPAAADRLRVAGLAPVGAPHAGEAPVSATWGAATGVSWERLPFGISRREDALSWQILGPGSDPSPSAGRRRTLTVVVDAAPASPHAGLLLGHADPPPPPSRLRATLHHTRWALPLATCGLDLGPEGMAWRGLLTLEPGVSTRLEGWGADGVVVDVHTDGVRRPALTAEANRDAQASRWAARGVTSGRLAAAASSVAPPAVSEALAENARKAFQRAARLYQVGHPGEDVVRLCIALSRPGPGGQDSGSGRPISRATALDDLAVGLTATEEWYIAAEASPERR